MRVSLALILVIGLNILGGCASSIQVEIVPIESQFDFSRLSSYKWDRSALVTKEQDGRTSSKYGSIIRDEIDRVLAARGYRKIAEGSADWVVDFKVTIDDSIAHFATDEPIGVVEPAESQFGLKWRFAKNQTSIHLEQATPEFELTYYQKGTLHIGGFDQENNLVWHAMAHKIINDSHSLAEHEEVLRKTVRLILTRFPSANNFMESAHAE